MLDAMNSTMLRRWWEEHSELDELVESIRIKLERGALSAASLSIERLATRLEGHFATEEDLYFPLIERVSPRSATLLESVRSSHRKLREGLEDLLVLVENADRASARRALVVLLHHLYQHEAEEVELIAELDRLASSTRPSA
jgi:hemerythrin